MSTTERLQVCEQQLALKNQSPVAAKAKPEQANKPTEAEAKAHISPAPPLWEGNLNSTHGSAVLGHPLYDEIPGNPSPPGWKVLSPGCKGKECNPCLTQLPVSEITPTMRIGNKYCTSCKPGYVLSMAFHKSKAGPCNWYNLMAPKTWCTELDKDAGYLSTVGDATNTLCQKIGQAGKNIQVSTRGATAGIVNKTIREAFIKGGVVGKDGMALAKCGVWKQTVCRSGNCQVKKEVSCLNVCKLVDYSRTIPGRFMPVDKRRFEGFEGWPCNPALCKEYGEYACKEIAMMI